eukprot:TRINITY_DN61_c0_g1_i1.p1 TRINITY_DN61_c0_g1~~TRINITY_DN61_c0_g1_i1.p1  ORF type:complete len:120 (-),score=39.06 TRINITY_DN61_c0_g1_i1:72-431(-)
MLFDQDEDLYLYLYQHLDKEYEIPSTNTFKITFLNKNTKKITIVWMETDEILNGIYNDKELVLRPDNEEYYFELLQEEGLTVPGQRYIVTLWVKVNDEGPDMYACVASFVIFHDDFSVV